MNKSLKFLFAICLSCILFQDVNAQLRYYTVVDPFYMRFTEIGAFGGFSSATTEVFYGKKDNNGDYQQKKAWGKNKMVPFYGFSFGDAIPLARVGDDKALALNITGAVTFSKFSLTNADVKIENSVDFSQNFNLTNGIISLSLDYKKGAEAVWDRELKTMFTIGAGPVVNMNMEDDPLPSINAMVKAEFGYFLGIAFKLRATVIFGNQNITVGTFSSPITSALPANDRGSTYKITSNTSGMLSLIIMPYSFLWQAQPL